MAKTEDISSISTEQLKDRIAVCDFCSEASRDCRLLPCLHVFCKNCLDDSQLTADDDADILMCPVCGQEFIQQPKTINSFQMSKKNRENTDQLAPQKSSILTRNSDEKESKTLEKPCGGCKEILCVACLAANRKGSGVMEAVKASRNAIELSVNDATSCKSNALKKLEAIDAEKTEFLSRSEFLKNDINREREELKRLVDRDADSLLNELTSWEKDTVHATKADIDTLCSYISSLDRYNAMCMEVLAKGSAKDIDLTIKNDDLLQMPRLKFEGQMNTLHVNLEQTKVKDLLPSYDSNIIGTLRDQQIPEFEQKIDKSEVFSTEEMQFTEKIQIDRLRHLYHVTKKRQLQGDADFKDDPVLIRTLKTHPAAKDNRGILGVTVLDDELYAVSKESSEVEVFDCKRLIFSCELEVIDLVNPEDIASCSVLKCLYIMDCKTSRSTNKILRIDPNGRLIRKWSTEDNWGHLSVTPRTNVLLSVYNRSKLKEFSPQGHLIRVLDFSVDDLDHIRHAIELTSGHFVVSHGEIGDNVYRVVKIDSKGNVLKAFTNEDLYQTQMKRPFHLETDGGGGSVFVADSDNGRILLFNSNLEFKRELLSSLKHGLRYPVRICFDETNGRLFVVDNQVGNKRISVFDIK